MFLNATIRMSAIRILEACILIASVACWHQQGGRHPVDVGPDDAAADCLRAIVVRDCPNLQDPRIDDWTRVCILRRWAYRNIDWSSPSCLLDAGTRSDSLTLDAAEFFAAFFRNEGGVYCGGTARAFMKLCQLFGFDACTLDSGHQEAGSHVVTLVSIHHAGRMIWCIQDATFNLAYVDENNAPLGYFELLLRLRQRRHDAIGIEGAEAEVAYRDYLFTSNEDALLCYRDRGSVDRLPNGLLRKEVEFTLEQFWDEYGEKIGRFLARNDYPAECVYLFLYPISIQGCSEATHLLAHARSCLAAPL